MGFISCTLSFLSVSFPDCSGKKPLEGPLKEELETALAMAERFTQQYSSLMKRFEEQMFNTSSILDLFNRQFGWVSSLANNTESKDGIFRVQTVCRPALSNLISFTLTMHPEFYRINKTQHTTFQNKLESSDKLSSILQQCASF